MMSKKGFTLVELAIVLVIIGIILAAVIKGQDLIRNARAKHIASKFKEWEIAQWNYYDRKGRFAGDGGNINSIIGDDTNDNVSADLTAANFINPPYDTSTGTPRNIVRSGSYNYFIFFGNDGEKNIMVLCKDNACNTPFNEDDIVYIETMDGSFDGNPDGQNGNFICVNGSPDTIDANRWVANFNNAPTSAQCTANTTTTVVYYFDSRR